MLFATAAGLRDSAPGQAALGRLAVAIVQTAKTISPEPNTTANYTNRQKWVTQVCSSPDAPFLMARTMFLLVVLTPPVETDIDGNVNATDADLVTAVTALVNTVVGYV